MMQLAPLNIQGPLPGPARRVRGRAGARSTIHDCTLGPAPLAVSGQQSEGARADSREEVWEHWSVIVSWLVRRRLRQVFADLGAGRVNEVLAGLAPDVHHRFAGDHALGGERHDRDQVVAWFARLYRLYPAMTFIVHRILVCGPPWRLTATVEWTAEVTPVAAPPCINIGAHVITIHRGRVTHLHAYEDSQAVAKALTIMAEAGTAEAAADPIG